MRTRVIPTLLLSDGALVKTTRFKKPDYLGDPINAVKIFNEKGVDELMLLDIEATVKKKDPDLSVIEDIASEAFMPLSYGGGITNIEQVAAIFRAGIEKVAFSCGIFDSPALVRESVERYGAQGVVAVLDVYRGLLPGYKVFTHNGKQRRRVTIAQAVKLAVALGVGELVINCIHRDGTWKGYDLDVTAEVSNLVTIPTVICGGAGHLSDFNSAVNAGADAVAAGSYFFYQSNSRGKLISYPAEHELPRKQG